VARFADSNDPFELLALNFRAEQNRRTGRNFKKEVNDKTGFISFSRNWIDPLMWSHYADRHKGICLGFVIPRADALAVLYNDERLLAELDASDEDPTKLSADLQDLLLYTKAKCWAYEDEVRRFVKLEDMVVEGALYFCAFSDQLQLREVIIGERCPLTLPYVRKLVRKHQPQAIAYNARLAFGSFSIAPIEHTIP